MRYWTKWPNHIWISPENTPTSHLLTNEMAILPISISQIEGLIMWFVNMRRLPFHIFYHRLFALENPILTLISFKTIREWLFVRMSVLRGISKYWPDGAQEHGNQSENSPGVLLVEVCHDVAKINTARLIWILHRLPFPAFYSWSRDIAHIFA